MSWVLASMLILGAALAAGFAWYERTHPTARVIALVATLAALAALGRIAFAALWAERTVLLGDGAPVADAPTAEVLGGGWYFATQTARILGGAALDPAEGAALVRARLGASRAAEVVS